MKIVRQRAFNPLHIDVQTKEDQNLLVKTLEIAQASAQLSKDEALERFTNLFLDAVNKTETNPIDHTFTNSLC